MRSCSTLPWDPSPNCGSEGPGWRWTFASLSDHRTDFLLGRGVWFPARNSWVCIPKQALSFHLSLRSRPWVLMRQGESTGKI